MNQDFALLPTPANARRLLMLQRACAMELSDEIHRIAAQGSLTEQDFDPLVCPYHPVKYQITQFLLDCNLRGVVLADYHPEYNEIALLHALKLAQVTRIHVITDKPSRWNPAIAALSLKEITHLSFGKLSNEDIDRHRHDTVLVVSAGMNVFRSRLRIVAREYPRVIVYQADDNHTSLHTPWVAWAHLLFPTMPHPLYVRLVERIPPAWHSIPLMRFAPFYNTCLFPDLISDPKLLQQLDDTSLLNSLSYTGLLNS